MDSDAFTSIVLSFTCKACLHRSQFASHQLHNAACTYHSYNKQPALEPHRVRNVRLIAYSAFTRYHEGRQGMPEMKKMPDITCALQ